MTHNSAQKDNKRNVPLSNKKPPQISIGIQVCDDGAGRAEVGATHRGFGLQAVTTGWKR